MQTGFPGDGEVIEVERKTPLAGFCQSLPIPILKNMWLRLWSTSDSIHAKTNISKGCLSEGMGRCQDKHVGCADASRNETEIKSQRPNNRVEINTYLFDLLISLIV